jgi:6-hydroxycyclohex-1-ene-1-carbonyl-CoA dehydrogenase
MEITVRGWRLTAPHRLERFTEPAPTPRPGHVLVAVAGCGVCHTDIGFYCGDVPTRARRPLVLGHEASGVVVAAADDARWWIGRRVLVPAVWPCGRCGACATGRATSCSASVMPGNDVDGAFASHVEAPARWLCPVDDATADAPVGAAGLALWEIAVVADAVTTPLQAVRRAGLRAGELAIVVGAGGVGAYAIQIARALGATVAALDVDPARLDLARTLGAAATLDAHGDLKALRAALRELAAARGLGNDGWRVFEVSGTRAGQELAFALVARGGSLSVIGFAPEPATVRLSHLMALDATAYGNWGCDPALYPEALALVASGQVAVRPLVRSEPLDDAPRVLQAVRHREIRERVVLIP